MAADPGRGGEDEVAVGQGRLEARESPGPRARMSSAWTAVRRASAESGPRLDEPQVGESGVLHGPGGQADVLGISRADQDDGRAALPAPEGGGGADMSDHG